MIKNKKRFHKQGLVEVKILAFLRDNDPSDTKHIVRLKSAFAFRNHLCLIFDLLSINLFEFLKLTQF